ncbi:hypothetical protein H072_8588 [Dactylellina haptotyla CBS 200.50]|uniref:Rrp15p-domain-containing protein n=1 Tax=Dactylellina haptotyla (strain CBS 200.50) TaxID=1284197 RepID=S8BEL9_DACHA|nr:hypothetical protein H072_8588 [Dactylellina haptotyla CBS 200.50]
MSIPPTKKRKLGAAAAAASEGAKLTKSTSLKPSLKSSTSKPQSTRARRPPPPEDDEEIQASSNSNDDSDHSVDNDGDVSDTNKSDAESSDYDLNSTDDEDLEDDEFPTELLDTASAKKRKRSDPTAFATSMSKILGSHLTSAARKDPILVRSKQTAHKIDDQKLEAKAKRLLTQQKREALEKGRVKDIIPKDDASGEEVKAVMEKEKALRKIAQRGVIKLFNAVRAAQVKGEEARKDSKVKGTLGIDTRNKNVTEISKESFLDMISKSK